MRPTLGSLVVYKGQAARVVTKESKKIGIELEGGDRLSVRPKDVILIHPGPLGTLAELTPQSGEMLTAWELLEGETTTLVDLAELVFTQYTPATAWATWQIVTDGLYFEGSPDAIVARLSKKVKLEKEARQADLAEKKAWSAFIERTKRGKFEKQDVRFIKDVEALAMGEREQSRVLRSLGHSENPQVAHAFLLKLGYWDIYTNPYPTRANLDLSLPNSILPELADEPRRDLTHILALAIDDAGSRDPDDALSWEDGCLWVHIADAAALVSPDSQGDLEARDRSATLYLPEATVPMLPPEAMQILGLGLTEISPALSFALSVNSEGEILDVDIVPSWVRVKRISYDEADARLDETPFRELYHLAQIFEARRRREGAIFIDFPEVKISVEDGQVEIRSLPSLRSRDLVREAMLMTGEAVAQFAVQHDIPIPFTSQAGALEELPSTSKLSEMYHLRRLMKPSQQRSTPAPHIGLGLAQYVQATSPLRRYLDLVVHQQLRAFLKGEKHLDTQELMTRVGAASAVTGGVRWTERRSREHWTLVYLSQHPEWRGEGIVLDRRRSNHLVLIPELGLETRINSRKQFPLDSRITLTLGEVNLPELETSFRLVI